MNKELPDSVHLKVVTHQKLLVDKEVKAVFLPTLEGYIGIFPGHRHLLTALSKGSITYHGGQKEEKFSVQGGFAEIFPDRVLVFTSLSKDEDERSNEE
jgi:F-type H+-transporting ATPase subunit epsilon